MQMARSRTGLLAIAVVLCVVGAVAGSAYVRASSSGDRSGDASKGGPIERSGDDKTKANKKRRITILYGTVTGTARQMANKLQSKLKLLLDAEIKLLDVKDYDEDRFLDQEDVLLFLCCTWSEGAPPEGARRFVAYLDEFANDFRVNKDHLRNVSFAVFGLGARIYDSATFCKPAKDIHANLAELGATPLLAPMFGDDASDLESKYVVWTNCLLEMFLEEQGGSSSAVQLLKDRPDAKIKHVTAAIRAKRSGQGSNKSRGSTTNRQNQFQEQQRAVRASLDTALDASTTVDKEHKVSCCGGGHASGEQCSAGVKEEGGDGCCSAGGGGGDMEEEEDLINNRYVTMDQVGGDDDEGGGGMCGTGDAEGDLEDLASGAGLERSTDAAADAAPREMVTKLQRLALTKEGYRLIGSHSAVKLCRWTKNQMRGRGGCYKHSFYGITSYQCMEATPSLACANKCVFCWRHHKNPVGTEWRWREDEPAFIVEEAVEMHRAMIREMKGVPGVLPERLAEALTVKHCALSLVGEPIMYPRINLMLRELHDRGISSFLVTNAQFPERIQQLEPVTQLYVSVDASTRDSLKAIDRPLFRDFWERFLGSLTAMRDRQQRSVYRMTLVKSWNMDEVEGYCELIELGAPDFIEIKAVTYCGKSDASTLTMENAPWHHEVCSYAESISTRLRARGISPTYSIATEHEHSCCVLLAREDKFKIDGSWHTWIDYDKFNVHIQRYYATRGSDDEHKFTSLDYMAPTPAWAVYQSAERGFDPEEQRWRRNKAGERVAVEYKSSESGCG